MLIIKVPIGSEWQYLKIIDALIIEAGFKNYSIILKDTFNIPAIEFKTKNDLEDIVTNAYSKTAFQKLLLEKKNKLNSVELTGSVLDKLGSHEQRLNVKLLLTMPDGKKIGIYPGDNVPGELDIELTYGELNNLLLQVGSLKAEVIKFIREV